MLRRPILDLKFPLMPTHIDMGWVDMNNEDRCLRCNMVYGYGPKPPYF
jgi:hypothetical protein